MDRYYSDKLAAEKLKEVYKIAPPGIRQYMQAEIDHVIDMIKPTDYVLEMGCGYGRVMQYLCPKAGLVVGNDTAFLSLKLARKELSAYKNYFVCQTDAADSAFRDNCFDLVICIQNGISAFKVDQPKLITEGVRLTKPGGIVLFSSYSEKIWEERLDWFEKQAEAGLLGEIDSEKTGNGVIICKDGFKATTVSANQFDILMQQLNLMAEVYEIENSSVFCKIKV